MVTGLTPVMFSNYTSAVSNMLKISWFTTTMYDVLLCLFVTHIGPHVLNYLTKQRCFCATLVSRERSYK